LDAVWIYTKDPSVQAFTYLMNQALDKPAEQMRVTGNDDGPAQIITIHKWQDRVRIIEIPYKPRGVPRGLDCDRPIDGQTVSDQAKPY
jgi:hypothetical protein